MAPVFGRPMLRFDTVGSTQDVARDLVRSGTGTPGTVIAAAFQTAGRGRRGRGWFAPEGANVCLTAVGAPVRPADAWQVALVAGLAVAEGVGEVTGGRVRPLLRFPNDVVVGGAKLAGVLVETTPAPDGGGIIPLVGIGVNVNVAAFPPDLEASATSLLRLTGGAAFCDVGAVERAVLGRLGAGWAAWRAENGGGTMRERWRAAADPEARRTFVHGGRPIPGCRVLDLRADGRVLVEMPGGRQAEVSAAAVLLGENDDDPRA